MLTGERASPVKWFHIRKGIRYIVSSTIPGKPFNGGTIKVRIWKKVREKMLITIQHLNLEISFKTIYGDPLILKHLFKDFSRLKKDKMGGGRTDQLSLT